MRFSLSTLLSSSIARRTRCMARRPRWRCPSPPLPHPPSRAQEGLQGRLSIYVGWMPWVLCRRPWHRKKVPTNTGIMIDVVQFNDYVESINQYTAGPSTR